MSRDPGLTQAICIGILGIFMLWIYVIGLGTVVDQFVVLAGELGLSPWAQQMMHHVLIYAEWFYVMIRVMAVVFLAYPFIHVFKRHRYREYRDEDQWM